jgi:chromosome segregation ATPase
MEKRYQQIKEWRTQNKDKIKQYNKSYHTLKSDYEAIKVNLNTVEKLLVIYQGENTRLNKELTELKLINSYLS